MTVCLETEGMYLWRGRTCDGSIDFPSLHHLLMHLVLFYVHIPWQTNFAYLAFSVYLGWGVMQSSSEG